MEWTIKDPLVNEFLWDDVLGPFRLYNSFELWLEETRLNKILHLRLESFPPAYDLNRLALIFANNPVRF